MGYSLIHESLSGAPDLSDSPSLLLSTAQASPDGASAYGNAQTASQAANYDAAVQAIKKQTHHVKSNHWNVFADVAHLVQDPLGAVKTAGGEALQALSKPLEDIQHEYRYVKDVYNHHGTLAAFGEGLRLAGGAAVGLGASAAVIASGGTLAPALAATAGAGFSTMFAHGGNNIFTGFKDSWDRSADASGSPGRDFAKLIHFDPHISVAGHRVNLVSGSFDAIFDISTDPTLKVGNGLLAANRAKYALSGPEDLARASQYRGVQRAFRDIIETDSPTRLMEKYPSLGPGLATRLAKAKSTDDIFQAYADKTTAAEMLSWNAPRLSFIRGNMARPIKDRLALLGIDTKGSEEFAAGVESGKALHGLKEETRPAAYDAAGNPMRMETTRTLQAPAEEDLQSAAGRSKMLSRGVERVYRRITTHLPLQYDINTGRQLTHEIDPMQDSSIKTIRDWAKYGNNRVVANSIADSYAKANTGLRIRIIRNLQVAAAAKMGMADHPELFERFLQSADDDMVHNHGFYGVAPPSEVAKAATPYDDGFNLKLKAADGSDIHVPAAIWTSQMGKISIPDFRQYRRAIDFMDRLKSPGVIATARTGGDAELAAAKSWSPYRFDDFMYQHLTRNFKRLALATGGFGLRVATGEALRETLNQGWTKYAAAKMADIGSRYGVMIRNGEQASGFRDRIAALAYSGAHRLDKASLDFMIASQMRHDGAWLPPVIDGFHNNLDVIESRPDRQAQAIGKIAQKTFGQRTGEWKLFGKDERDYATLHQGAVQQVITGTGGPELARTWRRALTANPGNDKQAFIDATREHAEWLRTHKSSLSGMLRNDPDVLANNRGYQGYAEMQLRSLQGLTEGPTLDADKNLLSSGRNNKLIDDIGNRRLPSTDEFRKYNPKRTPEVVPGQDIDPLMNSDVARLFKVFHHKVTAPLMNSLSRKPTFALRGSQEFERLKPYIGTERQLKNKATKLVKVGETETQVPLLSFDDAMDIAEHRAAQSMMPDIHNAQLRTQFHQIMENYAPFLFAKQQAFQRWGRLVGQDPNVLRRLEILHSGMKNIGFIQKDEATGQEYFAYPLSGYVGGGVQKVLNNFGIHTLDGVPLSFRGSMTSFRSILPGTQEETGLGLGGPLFFTSMKALQNLVPESAPFTEKALGEFSTSPVWTEWLPNPFIKNAVMAYAGDHTRAFQSAMMFGLQYWYSKHPGDFDNPDPRVQNNALAQAKNLARTVYIMKAVLGEGLPAAPQFQIGHPEFSTEFIGYLKKNHNYVEALDAMHKAHPHIDITPYTVFQSKSNAGGINIPPSQKALKFFQNNHELLASLPDGGAYLIPQDNANDAPSQSVYNEQVALGMRSKKTPEQFVKDLYAAHGDAIYYAAQKQYLAEKKGAEGNRYLLDQLSAAWKEQVHGMSLQNPSWADKHFNQDSAVRKDRAITQLQALFNSGAAPKGVQTDLVGGVLKAYASYKQEKDSLSVYSQTRGIQVQKRQLDLQWQNYLTDRMNAEPRLIPLIQGLFYDKALADEAGVGA